MSETANYEWGKPDVGGSNGTWGTELNTVFDEIDADLAAAEATADAALPKAGGVLTGRVDAHSATMKRVDLGATTGATSCDLAEGQCFTLTPSGNTTLAFTNKPSGTFMYGVVFRITGGFGKITWPTGTVWANGSVPNLSTGSGIDLIAMVTDDNGVTWRAFVLGQAFA